MKSDCYIMLKSLFVLEIFTFLSWLFGNVEKHLRKKAMIIFKIWMSQTGQTNNYKLKYTYYLISQEVKAIKQWNFVS